MKCPVADFDRLYHLMKQSSSAVGFLISLGQTFTTKSVDDLDNIFCLNWMKCWERMYNLGFTWDMECFYGL